MTPRGQKMSRARWRGRVKAVGLVLVWVLLLIGCSAKADAEAWHEDFASEEGWRLSSDAVADVAVVDDELQVQVLQPGQIAWAATEATWSDLRVAVDATQVAGPVDNEYGVLLRMDEDDRFYAFSISGDGYARAALYDSGVWQVLGSDWTLSDAIHQGEATNRLEVIARETTFEFRVNDQQVLQVEDTTLDEGSLGLYAGAFSEGGVVIAFDNLDVAPVE